MSTPHDPVAAAASAQNTIPIVAQIMITIPQAGFPLVEAAPQLTLPQLLGFLEMARARVSQQWVQAVEAKQGASGGGKASPIIDPSRGGIVGG